MISESVAKRLATLPHIKRARGYRLYAPQERRLLDLYQEGGRAILGHRPGKLIHDVKNVLERGVLSALPSPEGYRVQKVVAALLEQTMPRRLLPATPDYSRILLFGSQKAAVEAAVRLTGQSGVWDPVRVSSSGSAQQVAGRNTSEVIWVWRPFLPWERVAVDRPGASGVLVHLPLASTFSVFPLFVGDVRSEVASPVAEPALRAAKIVSHVVLSAAPRPTVGLPGFDAVGPYLSMKDQGTIATGEYDRRFGEFLRRDIVISPDQALPSILPAEMSDGEQKRLEKAAIEILGGNSGY